MRRWPQVVAAGAVAVVLLAATTLASLIALNAECNGSASECPRSDAYRGTLLALPVAAAVLIAGGAALSVRRRNVRPLVLAEAAVLALAGLVDAAVGTPGLGTAFLLAIATLAGAAALRRSRD